MKFIPREYQAPITRFIRNKRRCNVWATMGSGKTAATLKAVSQMLMMGRIDGPVLVLAPLRVAAETWPAEAEKWGFPEVVPIIGTPAERQAALKQKAHIFSINYENIPWLVEALGSEWPFEMVVADESTRLKSYRTRGGGSRAKALAKPAIEKSKRFVNLTGTPAPNGVADLWGQQYFIDAGLNLGSSFTAFQDRYFRPVRNDGGYGMGIDYVLRKGSQELIQERLKKYTITVDAAEYFGVDEVRHVTVEVTLPKKARKQYEDMEREFFAELDDGEVEALSAAGRSGKLLQMASGAVYLTDDGEASTEWEEVHKAKLDALESIVEELAGEPLLVAYHWRHDLERILKRFPKAVHLNKKDASKNIKRWNKGKIGILCAHPKSCGHGLNLQDGGCNIAFFSEWYDAEVHAQIIERIGPVRQHQSGHPRTVTAYHIRAKDTIDVAVALNLNGKISADKAIRKYMKVKLGRS